jgi:hypothetical protein
MSLVRYLTSPARNGVSAILPDPVEEAGLQGYHGDLMGVRLHHGESLPSAYVPAQASDPAFSSCNNKSLFSFQLAADEFIRFDKA